jgi:hypothetical protein
LTVNDESYEKKNKGKITGDGTNDTIGQMPEIFPTLEDTDQ